MIRFHTTVCVIRKASSRWYVSAPSAQMWSHKHEAATSARLTLPTCSQLLNTLLLIKLTSETSEAGMEGTVAGVSCPVLVHLHVSHNRDTIILIYAAVDTSFVCHTSQLCLAGVTVA